MTQPDVAATAKRSVHVQVEGVSKRYEHRVKGAIFAARDVTLEIRPGEFLTLLGPSGCGKTTLLRIVSGFEQPDAGRVRFDGRDVTRVPANLRNIGFVFQNYALFPHLSVFENVAYGLRVRGVRVDAIARRVADVLALVGLAGYEPQFPGQLSGGEQQRVALARAIVIEPAVLLFDEPLSNLDAKLRVQMRDEIRDLQRRLGITTLYVTHDQEEAMAVSDRIAVVSQGTVAQEGSAEDLYYRPASAFVATFIGRGNLVPGRIAGAGDGTSFVEMLGTRVAVKHMPAGVRAGDAVQVMVRPEAIELMPTAPATSPLRGTIVSHSFLGEKVEYLIRCGDGTLQTVQYSGGPGEVLASGAMVGLRLEEKAVAVVGKAA